MIKGDKYIQKFYKIRTKDGNLVTLKFNKAQQQFYELIQSNYHKKPGRYIVLKARQLGISTFTEALFTFLTTSKFNTRSVIIAHDSKAASSIYQMTKTYVNMLPAPLKPKQKYSNAKMLMFDTDDGNGLKSSIEVMVANDSTRGSTYQNAHLSELAFWQHPDTAMTAAMQTIPNTNESIVIIESTANGFNYFYDLWKRAEEGKSDFIPVFFPWYLDDGYQRPYDGFELTDYEKSIKGKFDLTNEQLAWRRWCIDNNFNGDETMFRQEYPITPEEAFITSGSNVFNTEIILARIKELKEPLKKGYFEYDYDGLRITNIRWVDDKRGYISIYSEPDGDFTAMGGDTAGEGEDYFTAHVLSREGNQMAVLHHQFDEDLYSKQVYCLGVYYKSLIGIEANFSTYPIKELQRLGYQHLYVREKYDQILEDNEKKYGFKTTSLTRPLIISNLVEIMREHIYCIHDKATLNEALSFVRINGKPQASEGTHDDLIMGLAIAYEVLKQIPDKQAEAVEEYYDEDEEFFDYGG